ADPGSSPPTRQPKKRKEKRGYLLFPDEPSFGQWFKSAWPDLLTIALSLIFALIVYLKFHPLAPRLFPFYPVYPEQIASEFSYPLWDEYIPTWMSALISFAVPFAFIGLTSIFLVGSFWDADSAIMGLSYALVTSSLFQVFVKWIIGGLRPHFYEVCKPGIHPYLLGQGYRGIYNTRSICTGDKREIDMALMSFPSGHSSAAFAGFIFLALYINAKYKVFADYHSRHWQLILFAAPILIAFLMGASKIIDYWHHWYDVLVGGIIGTLFAVWAYRMVYGSVFDYRY
ncbi:acid phosphatase/Vanadium-dependent haloperoxidase, partial [Zopfia rhizophila CBS 207.26]